MALFIFPLLYGIGVLVHILLGSYIYFKNPTKAVNRAFAILMAVSGIAMFSEMQISMTGEYNLAYFWNLIDCLWILRIGTALNFLIIFYGKWRFSGNKALYVLFYSLIAVSMAAYFVSVYTGSLEAVPWGWDVVPGEGYATLFDSSYIFATGMMALMIGVMAFYHRKIKDPLSRKQSKYVVAWISIPVAWSIATEMVIPLAVGNPLPNTAMTVFSFTSILAAYGMRKYELFTLTPEKAAADIIETMPDALILLDGNKNINTVNPTAVRMLGYGKGELLGGGISRIIPESTKNYAKIFGKDVEEASDVSLEVIRKDGESLPVSLSVSVSRYDKRTIKSIVLIMRDTTNVQKLIAELQDRTTELERSKNELESSKEQLEAKMAEAERLNKLAVGRELKMVELKEKLRGKAGRG